MSQRTASQSLVERMGRRFSPAWGIHPHIPNTASLLCWLILSRATNLEPKADVSDLPDESSSLGTLLTLASAFLTNVSTKAPRLVATPPVIPSGRVHMESRAQSRTALSGPGRTDSGHHVPGVIYSNRTSEMHVSPHVEKILGYTARGVGRRSRSLKYQRLYPEDRSRWNAGILPHHIALAEPFKGDYRFLANDGHIVWIHGEVTVARDESGRPSFLQGVGYEITGLKLAEEVLRRSGEELDQLVKARTAEIRAVNRSLETEIALRANIETAMRQNLKELADVKAALDEHAIVAITDPQGKITYAND